jgi:DNA-binding CsgD family transcriptional regulator
VDKLVERERELAAVDTLLERGGEVLLVEGRAGIGKTSLVDAACRQAEGRGHEILRARGSELEADFAFGVVRQLLERRLAGAEAPEREALLAGPAAAVRPLLLGEAAATPADDTSFAVLHGLYWLAANLAAGRPVLVAVDDAHWADEPSLRWLAHLAPRLEGLELSLLVALRADEPASTGAALAALRTEASMVVHPALLSEAATATIVRAATSGRADDELCTAVWTASGGNPLYLTELLRAIAPDDPAPAPVDPAVLLAAGVEEIARRVVARVRGLDPHALGLAQALAVLGDECALRHAAAIAAVEPSAAVPLAAGLVRREVLATADPPRFIHPVVRAAIEGSLESDERDAAHRAAARLLHADGAPAGQVGAHLAGVRPLGDQWALARLREAAHAAMQDGAPRAAADLLGRALAEPPSPAQRVGLLRETAHAEASAGRETACAHLEEALRLVNDPRERAEAALAVAEAYAALFRWVDAVDVIERALAELGDADEALAARLEGELVVCGLHDARRASRVAATLERLAARRLDVPSEALAVARGMAMFLTGGAADEIAPALEQMLARTGPAVENWDTRAALLWVLVATERFDAVGAALEPMLADVHRSGSARGLVAVHSTLGLLKLRLGALPEADAAARVALRVLREGDFAPGLAFAATVLAEVAVEAGELDAAQALLDLLPQDGWPPGVGTVLIPAARGRLRLAQRRPAEALADFETCLALFGDDAWGMQTRETDYVHARSGAALALMRLGQRDRACEMADGELADVRVLGAPRALGVALRVAGLARGGDAGLRLLGESVAALHGSPALLERAHSLAAFGAALRRSGGRAAAREPLAQALDLAARCGARPLAAAARDELKATGARPRRAWRTGVEALTPSELRVARLAAEGRSNREIAHELYVTLKTIEGHLARAYAKLGIEGRVQLREALDVEKTRVPTL